MEMKKIGIQLTILFAMVMCMVGMSSCNDEDDVSSHYGIGTITGIITDDYNAPLAGVAVQVDSTNIKSTTDSKGQYTLTNVDMGKHILHFTKENYQTMGVTVTPASYSNKLAQVDASMAYAAGKISGIVLDAKHDNVPLAGVTVSIGGSQSVTTGADGSFLIGSLPLDIYTITLTKSEYATITRNISIDQFIDGVATVNVTMGGEQILPGKTMDDLMNADHWYYSEYRGGRNGESYPHWDWSTDYMASLNFYGSWEEQNEGTTIQIKNSGDEQKNPANLSVLDSYVYGIKHITSDNDILTIQCRTHSSTADDPTVWGVQVVDLSGNNPEAVKVGDNRTLNLMDGSYSNEVFDLSKYIGKDIVIAIGTYRAKTGDYWKQLVLRRLAFSNQPVSGWGWIPGTAINEDLADWNLTREMVRSTMAQTKWSFTGISPQQGSRDNYQGAYQAWRTVGNIAAEWSLVPLHKDTEPFASEGFVIKTRGSGTPVSTITPESYFFAKFAIQSGHDHFVLKCRNFSGSHATFFKLTAIDENMNVVYLSPTQVSADDWSAAKNGCIQFIHQRGSSSKPSDYATFQFDLSQFDGKNIVLSLGVYKGDDNGDENKLCIYSINLN
ncbi:carboxypeptidase regulatory-like domain-containing protein [Prevotella cerevisiae]|jgi:hypothetical protein|uniref:Carboxypeptidase regulatory-like domain-containing protein n=1 Tax=Segatella cerevisiae TaxID=2053716 RepID=A0ABT1BU12_9BACT|nr:carboxypeptidase regulatory-like domain-containing protein [Segatella cerevisiae]MCO6024569.1 carboxypeptidase regulatory-like domain-containing protein [Segatella cerevisiae]